MISPGAGGGIDKILTSAGIGLLLGFAYVLTENLSFSIRIHFGGGFVLLLLSQEEFFGHTLPTTLQLSQLAGGPKVTYGIPLSRLATGFVLVLIGCTSPVERSHSMDGSSHRVNNRRAKDGRSSTPTN